MSTIFSTFSCHLTSLRSQCPAGPSSCPPWCPHRQERQEAVELVAFSTATALPSGMTRLRPWEGVSKCGAHSCPVTAVTHKHRHDGSKQRTFVTLQSGDRKSTFCLTGPKSRCLPRGIPVLLPFAPSGNHLYSLAGSPLPSSKPASSILPSLADLCPFLLGPLNCIG